MGAEVRVYLLSALDEVLPCASDEEATQLALSLAQESEHSPSQGRGMAWHALRFDGTSVEFWRDEIGVRMRGEVNARTG